MDTVSDYSNGSSPVRLADARANLRWFDFGEWRERLARDGFGQYFRLDLDAARALYGDATLLAAHLGLSAGLDFQDPTRSRWGMSALVRRGIVPRRMVGGVTRNLAPLWRREGREWITRPPQAENRLTLPAAFVDHGLPRISVVAPWLLPLVVELYAAFGGLELITGDQFDDAAYLGGLADELMWIDRDHNVQPGECWAELCSACLIEDPREAIATLLTLRLIEGVDHPEIDEAHRLMLTNPPRNNILGALCGADDC